MDDGPSSSNKPGEFGATALARYKPSAEILSVDSRNSADSRAETEGSSSATDDDNGDGSGPEDEDDEEEDASRDEASTPVTVTVTACVGFGKASLVRLGTSCGAALGLNLDAAVPWSAEGATRRPAPGWIRLRRRVARC